MIDVTDEDSPCSSDGTESAWKAGDLGLIPGLWWSLGERMATHPVFLPREFHGQRSLQAKFHGVA